MESSYVKVRTGIPGLDSIMSGGLRQGRASVLSGPPGSGKTTFGMQYLYAGANDFDEPAVFVTLSASPLEIKTDFMAYGWNIQKLIEEGKFLIIDARPFKMEKGFAVLDESLYSGEPLPFTHLTQLILNSLKRINAKRLVIDSLTVLAMQYSNKFYFRQGLQGMLQVLEDQCCTSIFISENSDPTKIDTEWSVASGIIVLNHMISESIMKRTLQILKMRGVYHSDEIHPIKLGKAGLEIHSSFMP